jgi:hypothetical protein
VLILKDILFLTVAILAQASTRTKVRVEHCAESLKEMNARETEGAKVCSPFAHINFKFSKENHDDLVLAIALYLDQNEKKPTNHEIYRTNLQEKIEKFDKLYTRMNIEVSAEEIASHWMPLRSIDVLSLENYGSRHMKFSAKSVPPKVI